MKSQIKNKKNISIYKFAELLVPSLNKFISYQFLLILLEGANYEQTSQNNVVLPPKVWGIFSKKKFFTAVQKKSS